MTKNDMHDDERHDDTYDAHEEEPDRGIMHVLREKVGLGYVAFGLLVVFIVFLGAKDKIMGYFVRTPEVAQKPAWEAVNQPALPSESSMPAQSDSKAIPEAEATSPNSMMPDDGQAAVNTAASNDAASNGSNNTVAITNSSAAMADDKMDTMKDFIMNNPEVIIESLTRFQQKRLQESKDYVAKSADKIISGKPFIGNKDGTLVITEFFDYRCGYCRKVYPDLLKLIKEYPDLKIVLIELPYGGDTSTKAAKFSLAVHALYPEQFYNFHTGLLNATFIDDKVIYALISQYNMDKTKLIEKANSDEIEKIISQNVQQATKAGVQGVPSFLINGEFVHGATSYSEFKKRLDALKKG
jgi:protein-disulfide isomerase